MTPRRVVATGTFDILHPGHLYYLSESKKLGDELFVIVARDANVKFKPRPIVPEEQRRAMIAALRPVDHAVLGDPADMFRPIETIRPDIITLGFNQYFNEEKLKKDLADRSLPAQVVRIGRYEGGELASSRMIVQRIIDARGGDQRTG
jgi:FAD synthetase